MTQTCATNYCVKDPRLQWHNICLFYITAKMVLPVIQVTSPRKEILYVRYIHIYIYINTVDCIMPKPDQNTELHHSEQTEV